MKHALFYFINIQEWTVKHHTNTYIFRNCDEFYGGKEGNGLSI